MKQLLRFLSRNAQPIWAIGGFILAVGEYIAAVNRDEKGQEIEGDTISERFKGLPEWVKLVIAAIIGGVFIHLAEWRIRDAKTVIVHADTVNTENATIEKSA